MKPAVSSLTRLKQLLLLLSTDDAMLENHQDLFFGGGVCCGLRVRNRQQLGEGAPSVRSLTRCISGEKAGTNLSDGEHRIEMCVGLASNKRNQLGGAVRRGKTHRCNDDCRILHLHFCWRSNRYSEQMESHLARSKRG